MKFTKFIAVAGAISMLASAIPFAVSAEETATEAVLEYTVVDGKAVITNVETDAEEFDIPAVIEEGEATYEVIGVEDWAFSLCENLAVVNVPDSLTLNNTGNVAFLTSSAVMNFMDNELGNAATVDDVVKYVADKANYKNGNYTDADLADVAVKLNNKLSMVDLSTANTVEGKVMTLLKNVDQMNLNADLQNNFEIWIATITYNGLTLCGNEGIEMQTYAAAREMLGMKYEVASDVELVKGDANGDGKFNVRDAAFIASAVAKATELEVNIANDYNEDGKVNVRDAAAMARDLSAAK